MGWKKRQEAAFGAMTPNPTTNKGPVAIVPRWTPRSQGTAKLQHRAYAFLVRLDSGRET
ncbi:hypothetical protein BFJ71_g13480 [Fusarium oxysporum]|nr:hypothetical protein BFJ71_g13480 [Fusarium oxysporum]